MIQKDPTVLLKGMRGYFQDGKTLPLPRRMAALRKLRAGLDKWQEPLCRAVAADFGRSAFDTISCELLQVREEIDLALDQLRDWAAPRRARAGRWNFPALAAVVPQPRGVVLILSPWNYPILLSLVPIVGAVAAGNCVVLRPSQRTTHTADALSGLLQDCFPPRWVSVAAGGHDLSDQLLSLRFDLIFFTGSAPVGRQVMQAAARYLTPVVLELGGKSPCIVDETADLDAAARRIAWGKFLNAGQTCVAPDYLLVQRKVADRLVEALCREINQRGYGDKQTLPQIITPAHTRRLASLLLGEKAVIGGGFSLPDRRIEPTILYPVSPDAPCMQEEIFGPILPVIVYDTPQEVIELIRRGEHPLALYHFSRNPAMIRRFLREIPAGGSCINDVVLQVASAGLPFGGVGGSGMGRYHGKASFDTFSHLRSVLLKPASAELPLRYPPHSAITERMIRSLLR